MRTLARVAIAMAVVLAATVSWYLAGLLIVRYDVGSIAGFWTPERLVAYGLFVLAPAVTFVPLARLTRIPLLDLEAVVAWSTLLYVWTFVDPAQARGTPLVLLLFVPLTMASASVFTVCAYLLGARFALRRGRTYDPVRAHRQGYLAAMFVVGCLLLRMLDVLTPVNVGLLALIVFLVEVLFLAQPFASERSP